MEFDEDAYFEEHSQECMEPDVCPFLVGRRLAREERQQEELNRQRQVQKAATNFPTQNHKSGSHAYNRFDHGNKISNSEKPANLDFSDDFNSIRSMTDAVDNLSLDENVHEYPNYQEQEYVWNKDPLFEPYDEYQINKRQTKQHKVPKPAANIRSQSEQTYLKAQNQSGYIAKINSKTEPVDSERNSIDRVIYGSPKYRHGEDFLHKKPYFELHNDYQIDERQTKEHKAPKPAANIRPQSEQTYSKTQTQFDYIMKIEKKKEPVHSERNSIDRIIYGSPKYRQGEDILHKKPYFELYDD